MSTLRIFPFLHALLTKRRTWGTPDLFIAVKEGEEDTTYYYSQRLNVKSALSTDICTCT